MNACRAESAQRVSLTELVRLPKRAARPRVYACLIATDQSTHTRLRGMQHEFYYTKQGPCAWHSAIWHADKSWPPAMLRLLAQTGSRTLQLRSRVRVPRTRRSRRWWPGVAGKPEAGSPRVLSENRRYRQALIYENNEKSLTTLVGLAGSVAEGQGREKVAGGKVPKRRMVMT